jgi:large subunit ribosomal protein L13e
LSANVERLKLYMSKLIVFPRRAGRVKKGDSTEKVDLHATSVQLPIPVEPVVFEERAPTAEEKAFEAFQTLRKARSEARFKGIREKRAREKEEEKK